MENQEYHKYSKIYNLTHREVKGYLQDECIVEEKIDGSQFSFGIFDGTLRIFSRNREISRGDVPKMFRNSVQGVCDAHDEFGLREGWTYRGEALQSGHHNTLKYDRAPKGHVIIFEIDAGRQDLLEYPDKYEEAQRIGLETVPMLYSGLVTQEVLTNLMKMKPYLGGDTIEGVVIKRMRHNTLYGVDKKVLLAKYVSNDFKERHIKNWNKDKVAKKEIPTVIAQQFATEARFEKALQYLKETDQYEVENPLRNIPLIINRVWQDIEEEEEQTMKDQLYNQFKRDIRKRVSSPIPIWFKGKLEKEIQFAD